MGFLTHSMPNKISTDTEFLTHSEPNKTSTDSHGILNLFHSKQKIYTLFHGFLTHSMLNKISTDPNTWFLTDPMPSKTSTYSNMGFLINFMPNKIVYIGFSANSKLCTNYMNFIQRSGVILHLTIAALRYSHPQNEYWIIFSIFWKEGGKVGNWPILRHGVECIMAYFHIATAVYVAMTNKGYESFNKYIMNSRLWYCY